MSGEELIAKAKAAGVEALLILGKEDISLLEVMDRVMAGETVYPHIPLYGGYGKRNGCGSDIHPSSASIIVRRSSA